MKRYLSFFLSLALLLTCLLPCFYVEAEAFTAPDPIAPDLITGPITWTGAVTEPKPNDAYVYIKANAAYSGRFDECGITIFDSNGKDIAAKTERANASNYLEIWYNITEETGAVLMPGKTYSYEYYVRFDGGIYYSDRFYFTTPMPDPIAPDLITGPITWTGSVVEPKATDAYVYIKANAAYSGRFDECGIVIYDANGNLVVQKDEATSASNYVEIWYNITEETGVVLSPRTTYYYQIYARFDGVAYWTDKMSFTTTMPESIAPDLITGPITWSGAVAEPKDTDAYVYVKANAAYSGRFDECGISVYDKDGNLVVQKDEATSASNYVEIWYNLTEETGVVLTPNTTYYYQIYAQFDGVAYWTDKMSFTTTIPESGLPDMATPIRWSDSVATPTDTNACLSIKATAAYSGSFEESSLIVFDENGHGIASKTEQVSASDCLQIDCNLTEDTGAVLTPGKTYTYQFRVLFNDSIFISDVYSFTTTGCTHHEYIWSTTVNPTCDAEGTETGTCTRCGQITTRGIPALAHDFLQLRVEAPSCSEKTELVQTCSHCGYSVTTYIEVTCPSGQFQDTPAVKNWAHAGVDFAVSRGLFNGVSDVKFDPAGDTTRAMLVTVLWRYAGTPEKGSNVFYDVAAGKWYEKAIAWANSTGVVNGVGGGKFDPNGCITRQQLATILYRYSTAQGIDTGARASLSSFPDHGSVSGYAVEAMQWAVAEGLINGSGGNLLPKGNATRAQVATILMRYIENIME